MEILLQDLLPGQEYLIQLRSKNFNGISQWSRAYYFTTDSDTTPPSPVTGLTWQVSRASFIAQWTKPTTDSNGQDLKDFKDFKITLTADAQNVVFYVTEERFDLTLERNVGFFGAPKPTVQIKVEVRDNMGNLSSPVTTSATNSIPPDITNFDAEPILKGISLSWDPTTADDLKQYEVYMSTSGSGFTPGPSNLVYVGTANKFVFTTANQTVHYFKARQVDLFNQGSSNYAADSATPQGTGDLDTTPPNSPSTVTVSTSAGADGSSAINVTWASVASSNLRNYIVRYSLDQVTWQYITVPSTDTSTAITGLLANTNYYVGVASSSYLSTRSSFTAAGTYPITTAADAVAPSTPSAPTVSVSTFMAQVNHDMTKVGGGDLEADVDYLEVHASNTTGFTPDLTTLRGTILAAGQGIDISAVFEFSPTDSMTNLYWRVIAVDRAKNKSAVSAQATGLPGLIATANIANLAVTNAKVNDLSAAKLTAGTAFINDLFIRSNIVIDNSTGHIKSNNYDAGAQTGWTLDQNGLIIYNGTISASALQLQDSQNIAPLPFSDFEFNEDYYHNSSNVANVVTSTVTSGMLLDIVSTPRTGRQSIRVYNAAITNPTVHNYIFAPDGLTGTNANVEVNPGDYIISVYMKKNGTPNQNVKLGLYTDTSTSIQSSVQSVTSTSWTRYSAVLTVPSGAQKVKVYIEIGPQSANTGYDILLDSVQLERKMAGSTSPSPWTPPSETRIDGGAIVTGSIRSSSASATVSGQPAWSINTAGNMQIGDALVRGSLVVGAGSEAASIVQSGNYVTNTTGWIIKGDGSVEFNDGLFRGDIELTTTISSKEFSVDVGNMDSYFIWEDGNTITGQEPTILFRGWSFKSNGVGGFDPKRQLQSVIRLTPFGEFQIMFDPSHSSDILSVDGNNQRDAAGNVRDRYYGWTDFRMGMGDENETSYANQIEGRDPFANTYYYDTYSTANSIQSMGADTEVSSRINGFAEADGSISQWNPSSRIKLESIVRNYLYSTNMIQDGMDLFDNAGGVTYYSTNTLRNRMTINSIPTNLIMDNSGGWGVLYKGLDITLTAAGTGNPSIAFTSGASTYPITVAAGDEYYMKFHGYRPSALSLQYRFFMKTNTGVTVYPTGAYAIDTFATGVVSTSIAANDNYAEAMDNLLVVPAGATSAYFGIELIGTIATNQVIRIACIQLNKVFNVVSGQKQLVSNFDFRTFTAVGDEYYGRGEASITMECFGDTAEENGTTLVKTTKNATIKFNVIDRDDTPGSLGEKEANMTLYGTGLLVGSYGEPKFSSGVSKYMLSSTSVAQNTVSKLIFDGDINLDTLTGGTTFGSHWRSNGDVYDNSGGYTKFVAQRAGMYILSVYLDYNTYATQTNEYHVLECIKDSNGAYLGVYKMSTQQERASANFVLALSVGEKVYVQVYHAGVTNTKTYNTNSRAHFAQLL
jgi:hypothetical protein